jgi:hypothetical protein
MYTWFQGEIWMWIMFCEWVYDVIKNGLNIRIIGL